MKIKIAFLIGVLGGGGAERVIANLSSTFAEHDYDTTVITFQRMEEEYKLSPLVKRINLNENGICHGIKTKLKNQIAIRKICRQETFDVLVSFMMGANYHAVAATLFTKTKTIISVRNDPRQEYFGRVNSFIAKLFLPFANGCVFQTEDAMNWFPVRLRKKSTIIFNPINKAFYDINPDLSGHIVMTSGRLEPQKNHEMLISVFKEILTVIPDAKLHIYGVGRLQDKLQDQILNLDMSDSVCLCGYVSDMPNKLKQATIFVLTSDFEGMPNALMEAMAAGIPCVAIDCPCGGVKVVLQNGEYGVLVAPRDREAVRDALINLLTDEKYRAELSKRSKTRAQYFNSESVFTQWESYIEKLLS